MIGYLNELVTFIPMNKGHSQVKFYDLYIVITYVLFSLH